MRTGIWQLMPRKPFAFICGFLGLLETGHSQFIAYNDHVPGVGTGPNVTTWSINTNNIGVNPPPPPLPLKDVTSGATLGITVQFATNRVIFAGTSGNPFPGTPAYTNFHGYVDFGSAAGSSVEVAGVNSSVTNILNGLDPNKTYTFRGTAVRGGPPSDHSTRWSLFTLLGASSFRSAHTTNAITSALDVNLSVNQVAINTGVNTNFNQGDFADWEEIRPLSNTIMIVSTHYSDDTMKTG